MTTKLRAGAVTNDGTGARANSGTTSLSSRIAAAPPYFATQHFSCPGTSGPRMTRARSMMTPAPIAEIVKYENTVGVSESTCHRFDTWSIRSVKKYRNLAIGSVFKDVGP